MPSFAVTSLPLVARFGTNANAGIPCDRRSGCDSGLSNRAQDRTSGPQGRSCQRRRRLLGDADIPRFSRPNLPDRGHVPPRLCSRRQRRIKETIEEVIEDLSDHVDQPPASAPAPEVVESFALETSGGPSLPSSAPSPAPIPATNVQLTPRDLLP